MTLTLTIIMLLPLLGAAIIAAMPAVKATLVKQIALATTVVVAVATIVKALSFNTENTALQFRQSYSWIPSFAINWAMGVDGIALVLILMSVVLAPVVILAGPFLGRLLQRIEVKISSTFFSIDQTTERKLPAAIPSFVIGLLPILLITLAVIADNFLSIKIKT